MSEPPSPDQNNILGALPTAAPTNSSISLPYVLENRPRQTLRSWARRATGIALCIGGKTAVTVPSYNVRARLIGGQVRVSNTNSSAVPPVKLQCSIAQRLNTVSENAMAWFERKQIGSCLSVPTREADSGAAIIPIRR